MREVRQKDGKMEGENAAAIPFQLWPTSTALQARQGRLRRLPLCANFKVYSRNLAEDGERAKKVTTFVTCGNQGQDTKLNTSRETTRVFASWLPVSGAMTDNGIVNTLFFEHNYLPQNMTNTCIKLK